MIILCRAHDEKNQGAKTPEGLSEWEIARDINRNIHRTFQARYKHDQINHFEGTLYQRIQTLKNLERVCPGFYEAAIECHCNSSANPRQTGFSVLTWHKSKESIHLANVILDKIKKAFPHMKILGLNKVSTNRRWIGTRKSYGNAPKIAFLEDTPQPAVLIEMCYLSNKENAKWISNQSNRHTIGYVVGQSIDVWINEKAIQEEEW